MNLTGFISKLYDRIVEYCRISGRIDGTTYLGRVFIRWVISLLLLLLFGFAFDLLDYLGTYSINGFSLEIITEPFSFIVVVLFFAFTILYFVVTVAQEIKRLHDFDYSGWWTVFRWIPYLNLVYFLILVFKSGMLEDNQYGPGYGHFPKSQKQIQADEIEVYASKIIKTCKGGIFSNFNEEEVRNIVRDYSQTFSVEMNEEIASQIINEILNTDMIEFYASEIAKTYNHATFSVLSEERVRKIVNDYSYSFRVEMNEETVSQIVKELMKRE